MNRRKQVVKKGIWYIGGKKRKQKQKGGAFLLGLLNAAVGPLLGEVAKPLFKKIFGRGKRRIKW